MYLSIRQNKSAVSVVAIMVVVSIMLYMVSVTSKTNALLGLGIIWVSLLPGVIYILRKSPLPVPFFPASGVYYAFFFGLPVFTIPLAWPDASSIVLYTLVPIVEVRSEVLILILLGIVIMGVSYFIFRNYAFKKISRLNLFQSADTEYLNLLFWALLGAHFSYEFLPAVKGIASIGQLLKPAGYLAFGGLYLLWRRKKMNSVEILVLFSICLPLEIFARFKNLFLTDIILFGVFFIFVFWRERQYKLLFTGVVFSALILASYGTTTSMRSSSKSSIEKMKIAGDVIYHQLILGKKGWQHDEKRRYGFGGRFSSLVARTSQTWIFHAVDDRSPIPVPYWNGETYRPMLTSFIPRIFYPGKQLEKTGGEFGKRYGFLPHYSVSSINLPWLTEMLANFGRWGVIWGMVIIGMFLAFLDRVFNSPDANDLEFVFGLTLIFPLVYPESNFSVMTGSMLPLFVSLYIYFVGGTWILNNLPIFNRTKS